MPAPAEAKWTQGMEKHGKIKDENNICAFVQGLPSLPILGKENSFYLMGVIVLQGVRKNVGGSQAKEAFLFFLGLGLMVSDVL